MLQQDTTEEGAQTDEGNTPGTTRFPCFWKNGDPAQGQASKTDCADIASQFETTHGPNSKMGPGDLIAHKCSWAEDCPGENRAQCALDNGNGAYADFYSNSSTVVQNSPGPLQEIEYRKRLLKELATSIGDLKEEMYADGRGKKNIPVHGLHSVCPC